MAIAKNCHLISVVSGKGGVGKSVFSTNFAMSLALTHKAPVLLMDLDTSTCGDLNILMGMKPNVDLDAVLNLKQALNSSNIKTLLPSHPSGVSFIPGVLEASKSLSFEASKLTKFLNHASQFFKFIICDLGTNIDSEHLRVLELSSAAVTVTTPDLLTTNQTKKFLNQMMSETLPIELFSLVVNKVSSNSLKPESISKALGLPLLGLIPQDDVSCFGAMSKKSPFAYSSPKSLISQSYYALVRKISGGQLDQTKRLLSSKVQKKALVSSKKDEGTVTDSDIQFKIQVHNTLIQEMDLKKDVAGVSDDPKKLEQLNQKTKMLITKIVDQRAQGMDRDKRATIIKESIAA